jgi:uncharacterized protein
MPALLKALSVIGTLAMLWVGGGIIIHGLAGYGWSGLEHAIHGAALAVASVVKPAAGFVEWLVSAGLSGAFGLIVGFVVAISLLPAKRLRAAAKA